QTLTMPSPPPSDCPTFRAVVDLGSYKTVELVAYDTSCVNDHVQPGNGRHGVYHTTADIPADRRSGAITVHTALGQATAFEQTYYECTNSCKDYTEPIGVITLAHSDNPAYQALVAYSPKGAIGMDRFTAFLRDQLQA